MSSQAEFRPEVYFAAPLFSAAELQFNRAMKASLAEHVNVFLPQEDGELLADAIARGEPSGPAARRIFGGDCDAIRRADALVILLDGRSVDEGAAFELGYAYALGKPCIGLQTDTRRLLSSGNNPMIDGALAGLFSSLEELLVWAQSFVSTCNRSHASHQSGQHFLNSSGLTTAPRALESPE